MNVAKTTVPPFVLTKKKTKKVKRGNIQDYFNRSPNKKSFYNVIKSSPLKIPKPEPKTKETSEQPMPLEFDIFDLLKTKNESNSNLQVEFTERARDNFREFAAKLQTFSPKMHILLAKKVKLVSKKPWSRLARGLQAEPGLRTFSFVSTNKKSRDYSCNLHTLTSVFSNFRKQPAKSNFAIRVEHLEIVFSNHPQVLQSLQSGASPAGREPSARQVAPPVPGSSWFCLVTWKKKIEVSKRNKIDGVTIDQHGKVIENGEHPQPLSDDPDSLKKVKSALLSKILKHCPGFSRVQLEREDVLSDEFSPFEAFRHDRNMSHQGLLFRERQLILVFQMIVSFCEVSRNALFSLVSDFAFDGSTTSPVMICKNKKAFLCDSLPNNFQSFQEEKSKNINVVERVLVDPRRWTRVEGHAEPEQADVLEVGQKEDFLLELEGSFFGRMLGELVDAVRSHGQSVLVSFE